MSGLLALLRPFTRVRRFLIFFFLTISTLINIKHPSGSLTVLENSIRGQYSCSICSIRVVISSVHFFSSRCRSWDQLKLWQNFLVGKWNTYSLLSPLLLPRTLRHRSVSVVDERTVIYTRLWLWTRWLPPGTLARDALKNLLKITFISETVARNYAWECTDSLRVS